MPELTISPEKVGFLIEKARQFDVKEAASDPDSGSNAIDDDMIDVLEDDGSDPVAREIAGFIDALSEDEQIDLVALMRLGRGDGTIEEWKDLRRQAAERRSGSTARYLLGEPMLGDLLAEGLDEFGLSWTEVRTTPIQ
jgi:RecB family endonuclease NucS